MVPPAPVRGSTMTWWPQASVSLGPIDRAMVSGAPPGAPNASTKRTGLAGYACATAMADDRSTGTAQQNARASRLKRQDRVRQLPGSKFKAPLLPGGQQASSLAGHPPPIIDFTPSV